MVFNSLLFLFGFLPIVYLLYRFIANDGAKNILLLVFSLIFYSWLNPVALVALLLSIAFNYVTGLQLEQLQDSKRRKQALVVSVIVNLLILGVFKYTNFILNTFGSEGIDIMLPVGLSFFTFMELSYIFDVYNHTSQASHNIIEYALYVSLFPKINMGPIVSYHEMQPQLKHRTIERKEVGTGWLLLIKGLFKKVILADNFAIVFASLASSKSVIGTWLMAITYLLQLYYDFSGYSDMAIGIGKMFGFDFGINFDHPLSAISVQDFWRRWHISLSTWFRDYLYIPLGGNRKGQNAYIRNILIVWLCTGIWHGANWTFILWGLYFGALLLLERFVIGDFLKQNEGVSRVYTFIVAVIGFVFFFSPTLIESFQNLGRMIGIGAQGFIDGKAIFELWTHLILYIVGFIFTYDIFENVQAYVLVKYKKLGQRIMLAMYSIVFLLCVAFIVGSTYQSFLYSAF